MQVLYRGATLANDSKQSDSNRASFDSDRLKQRIDLTDERLDNIDSVVTAVAERVMKQPVSLLLTCPHCGKNIEVALVGQQKPT
jgi:hypothetical protein